MIRSFEVHSTDIDEKGPWTAILSTHEADWSYIKQRREDLLRNNNEQENKKRKTHNSQIGDKVLLKGNRATKYGTNTYSGPYPIEQINSNETVKIRINRVTD
eukprot:6927268-Ditylum_brightwellii.AAC.1